MYEEALYEAAMEDVSMGLLQKYLETVTEQIIYKDNFHFDVTAPEISIMMWVKDRVHGRNLPKRDNRNNLFVNGTVVIDPKKLTGDPKKDDRYVMNKIRMEIRSMELHEVDEMLVYKGVQFRRTHNQPPYTLNKPEKELAKV